ncbi:MAG: hypothetical protein ACJAUH_000523 [Saprospiraceae bacterium]|jgi:hypothetical protein
MNQNLKIATGIISLGLLMRLIYKLIEVSGGMILSGLFVGGVVITLILLGGLIFIRFRYHNFSPLLTIKKIINEGSFRYFEKGILPRKPYV